MKSSTMPRPGDSLENLVKMHNYYNRHYKAYERVVFDNYI